jgi:hypothetical protein
LVPLTEQRDLEGPSGKASRFPLNLVLGILVNLSIDATFVSYVGSDPTPPVWLFGMTGLGRDYQVFAGWWRDAVNRSHTVSPAYGWPRPLIQRCFGLLEHVSPQGPASSAPIPSSMERVRTQKVPDLRGTIRIIPCGSSWVGCWDFGTDIPGRVTVNTSSKWSRMAGCHL